MTADAPEIEQRIGAATEHVRSGEDVPVSEDRVRRVERDDVSKSLAQRVWRWLTNLLHFFGP